MFTLRGKFSGEEDLLGVGGQTGYHDIMGNY